MQSRKYAQRRERIVVVRDARSRALRSGVDASFRRRKKNARRKTKNAKVRGIFPGGNARKEKVRDVSGADFS